MSATLGRLVRRVRVQVDPSADAGDASLLARWVDHADQAAFELLLWRHGPMVWRTCRRVLRHDQDAEDAFQAAFLTLARKAASIRKTPSVAGWLYRVAHRAALAARGRTHPEARDDLDFAPARPDDQELRHCLDEELARLPERHREAFVLCCLEGLTTDEAAAVLGCPRGTVGTHVAQARRRLRERLGRELPAVLPAGAVPAALAETALNNLGGAIAPPVDELCREVMTMLMVSKIKGSLVWLVPVLLVMAGLGGVGFTTAYGQKPADDKKGDVKPPAEKKPTAEKKGDKKPDENKPAAAKVDVVGVVKSVDKDGKRVTILTKKKTKETDEATFELLLDDKTQVLFSSVGPGEAAVKEGYVVSAWLAEKSKDVAAKAHFTGEKHDKGDKPALAGAIVSVAEDGKSLTILVKGTKKNENDVERTLKLGEKSRVTFDLVGTGEARLAKDMTATVWLAEGSKDTAGRVTISGKAEVPGGKKTGGDAAYAGTVTALAKDGKSFTLQVGGKKNEEVQKVELKLGKESRQVYGGVGKDGARLAVGQHAAVWVKADAKDTVSVGYFRASAVKDPHGVFAGRVASVANDGKSFTMVLQTKKDEEGKKVTIKLDDRTRLIFDSVGPGAARITRGQAARIELATDSKDVAAAAHFSAK